MLVAVFKIMWLRLWRDKGALVLAFLLPGFIFAIFAAIFSNASGGDLDIQTSMALTSPNPVSQSFAQSLLESEALSPAFDSAWSEDDIRQRVRRGEDDVGFVIYGDVANPALPSIFIIKDPSREIAATILMGQLRLELAELSNVQTPDFFMQTFAVNFEDDKPTPDQSITYYIGATAILFLLFSAMQGASLSLDERKSGISDRLLTGPKGTILFLVGKFLFLTCVGTVQALVIVLVAGLFFGVPVWESFSALCFASLSAAAFAASLALLTASLSGSATQMHTVSTFLVLLFSAIGGSMVPRFMMPSWLQSLGEFTPNHWVIEAYYGILARGQSLFDLLNIFAIQWSVTGICLFLAAYTSHRWMRL